MVLSAIPGVGERLAMKITDHFGSEEKALSTLRSGDIGQIAEIDGISPKRALALARSAIGDNGQFLATKEAEKLHQKLIDNISIHIASKATKNRLQLLTPIIDNTDRVRKVNDAIDFLNKNSDYEQLLRKQLGNIVPTKNTNDRYDRVVVSPYSIDELKNYCRVLNPAESETWKDYTVFSKVTWIGSGAPSETPDGWIVLGSNPQKEVILPEKTLDWFTKNLKVIDSLCEVLALLESTDSKSKFNNYIKSSVKGFPSSKKSSQSSKSLSSSTTTFSRPSIKVRLSGKY